MTGEAEERSGVTDDTPVCDLYGGGDDRALLSVAELDRTDTEADVEGPSEDQPPSKLVVITTVGEVVEVVEVGPQAPTGPASISLDGTMVLQPDGDSVQVDRIG